MGILSSLSKIGKGTISDRAVAKRRITVSQFLEKYAREEELKGALAALGKPVRGKKAAQVHRLLKAPKNRSPEEALEIVDESSLRQACTDYGLVTEGSRRDIVDRIMLNVISGWEGLNIKKMIAIAVVTILVISVAFIAIALLDVAGYNAKGSETLVPTGIPLGKAMVVYDPGLSGWGSQAARVTAEQLRDQGYVVELAGVSSDAARNLSGCSILIVGGPMYGGHVASSVEEYIKGLSPPNGLKMGVFTTTGSNIYNEDALKMLQEQIDSITEGKGLNQSAEVSLILTDQVDKNCSDLISAVLN
jgi:flavodoxin